jgi:hypothetical protein
VLRKNRLAACIMLSSFAASACQDLATSAAPNVRESLSRRAVGTEPNGQDGEYVCYTSELRLTGGHPYRHTRVALHFPKSELASNAPRLRFHLRIQTPGQNPVAAANCTIPYTRAAAERLYATFTRIFRKRARLDPLAFPIVAEERRFYLGDRRAQGGPHFDTTPTYSLPGVTAYGTPTNEGGATGWTGTTGEWGWGSQGDAYYNGGGDSWSPDPTPEECHADTDPRCNQPLTHADSAILRSSLARYKRPANQFTDSIARRRCDELFAQFESELAQGKVFRGLYDSTDSTAHYGETYQTSFHIDPSTLNAAEAGDTIAMRDGVAVTALHETGHLMGYSHGLPTWVNHQDYYTEYPFNLVNPGPNTCIVR